jgi:hypothetical protein
MSKVSVTKPSQAPPHTEAEEEAGEVELEDANDCA